MDHRVNIINVASTQIQIYSLDGPTCSGGFKLKKHGKIVGRLTCLSSLGTNTLSLIKIKKNSVSVSKLITNIIKNGENYLFQVQNKEFMSKNYGESLHWVSVMKFYKQVLSVGLLAPLFRHPSIVWMN